MKHIAGSEHTVTDAVKERNSKDGMVTAPDAIGKPGAEERHEIIYEAKEVNDRGGAIFGLEQRGGDVERENALHPVITEALGGFVPDDEFYLFGPAVTVRRSLRGVGRNGRRRSRVSRERLLFSSLVWQSHMCERCGANW